MEDVSRNDLLDYLTRDERMELVGLRTRLLESKCELGRLKREYEVMGVDERLCVILNSIEEDRVRVSELHGAAERRKGIHEKVMG